MKKLNKKGISLIVLVVTIIVMLILAAAVIISLSNNGIIGKANEAVDENGVTVELKGDDSGNDGSGSTGDSGEVAEETWVQDGTNLDYWLASPYVVVSPYCADFGLCAVNGGVVLSLALVYSYGDSDAPAYGVRAVVSLASDTQLTEADTEGSWEIVTETAS